MSPKKIAKPLDIYVRVSDVRGRNGDSFISPKDQEQRCRALATARNFNIGQVFTDLDKSGGTMDRPAFNEALARIESGVSGGIIVARMDRFSRTLKGAIETIEAIEKAGGYLIECEGDWDTSTPMGRFGRDLVIRLGRLYREQIADTWVTSKRHAVERGIHISSRVPPGYVRGDDRRLVPDPVYGPAMTTAYKMAADGATPTAIAAHLTAAGVPSNGGKPTVWQSGRIYRLLANRVYLGEARNGHGDVNTRGHEPLVDERIFKIAQRPVRGPVTTEAVNLLAGIARCAGCSFAMKAQKGTKTVVPVYRCTTHTIHGRCPESSTISKARLEDYVIEQFLEHVPNIEAAPVVAEDDASDAVVAAVEAERSYKEALTNIALRRQIGDDDHDRLLGELHRDWQASLALVPERRQASRLPDSVQLSELVERLRHRGDIQGLRELLGSAIQAVYVRPAASRSHNLPVADRVKVVFVGEERLDLPRRGERFEPRPYAW